MNESKNITEVIILAGGLGTRLRESIGDFPKPLAPIAGKPFLIYLLDYISKQSITSVVLAVGYKWQLIRDEFGDNYKGMTLSYSVEDTPLGTGGAIKLASKQIAAENCFVINGDTLFAIELKTLSTLHLSQSAACTVALKSMLNNERYGSVEIDSNNRILAFKEKEFRSKSLINGGIYCLHLPSFNENTPQHKFSFETEYLEMNIQNKLFGLPITAYFKDIGIPKDYQQFEKDILNNAINGI